MNLTDERLHHNPENPYNPDVLIRKIKKNPELFKEEITKEDEEKIRSSNKRDRCIFIFCELVKEKKQANVNWIPRPITQEDITQAKARIYSYLEEKNIPIDDYQKEISAIFKILIIFESWSKKPIIIDKEYQDKDEKGAWRRQMQEIFDDQGNLDKLEGPFTDFYENNAVRTNSLNAVALNIFALFVNFQKMGVDTDFKQQQETLVKRIKEINKIMNYEEKTQQQQALVKSIHVIIRRIINTIGSDKT